MFGIYVELVAYLGTISGVGVGNSITVAVAISIADVAVAITTSVAISIADIAVAIAAGVEITICISDLFSDKSVQIAEAITNGRTIEIVWEDVNRIAVANAAIPITVAITDISVTVISEVAVAISIPNDSPGNGN